MRFFFGAWLRFKTSNVKDPALSRPDPCPGVEPLHALSDVPCHRKTVLHLCVAWNPCCSTVKISKQVIYHLCLPLFPADKSPFAAAFRVFCPWKGKIFSSKCTSGWGMLSPSATKVIPTQCCGTPGPVPSFSPGVDDIAHSGESCPLPKPQSLSSIHYLQKTYGTQYPLLPRWCSVVFFILCELNTTLSQLLSVSLPMEKVPFPLWHYHFCVP